MSSAKLAIVPDPSPLPVRVEDGFSQIFGAIDKLENLESVAAELAPDATDKQLIDGRVYATQLGKTAWKIVVIFDAEIWKRTERLVGGRGAKDVDEKGIMKAVDKQAHELGCGASTIYANARIFKTFKTTLTTQNTLEDKGFYQAALAAKDPRAAIEHFTKQRSENPFYRPADAWRYVNATKKPCAPRVQRGPALQKIHDKAVREELDAKIALVREWPMSTVDPLLATVYRRAIEMFEWQRDRDIEKDCAAIMKIFAGDEGTEAPDRASDDYISVWLHSHGFVMSEDEIGQGGCAPRCTIKHDEDKHIEPSGRLGLMVRLKMLTVETREESRGPTQRGVITSVYGGQNHYMEMLDGVSILKTLAERNAAIHVDWLERLERYAPELLPKKDDKAKAA
ncbi:MAG TPA: hypothetical protein VFX97_16725 [Pyrinomonadaceae bacterium]|nr:hypothetical protein [Pyrinomonadaceae bacterium]